MPVVLNLDGQHPKCKIPNDSWRIAVDSEGRDDVKGYWNLSFQSGPLRWEELSKLKQLSELTYRGPDASVVDYLCSKKCTVSTFTWIQSGRSRFDFSAATCLTTLGLEDLGPSLNLKLPVHGKFEQLRLPCLPEGCRVTVAIPDKGREVCLILYESPFVRIPGLKELEHLELLRSSQVDLADVVKAYPRLQKLDLSIKSGAISNIDSLTKLKHLESLRLFDCYEFDTAKFPDLGQMPMLQEIYIDGIRAEDAKVIAAKMKGIEELTIYGKRTDQWIADNWENPFRDWDDYFGPTVGKRAMDAWKTASAAIEKFTKRSSKTQAKSILRAFVDVFNKIDDRSGLETDQRELVFDTFVDLVERLPQGGVSEEDYFQWASYA